MVEALAKNTINQSRMKSDDAVPKIGQFYWVNLEDERGKSRDVLMAVYHLASNHVEFRIHNEDERNQRIVRVRYRELLAETRLEPNWRGVIQKEIEIKQIELATAVKQMGDKVRNAGLLPNENADQEPPTLLPAVQRRDPKEAKKDLARLKDKTFPAAVKEVDRIMQSMVALQKDLMLPMLAESKKMRRAVDGVEDRMFVLELYAGLCETAKQIREGTPAQMDEKLTIRQMIRFMDEETLIDYDKGGMNFEKLREFDEWIARDENLNRVCPEQRCVVAFKVRRHDKDYGRPLSLGHAFQIMKMMQADRATYLLIRNGTNVWRIATDIDFEPRLLPIRGEFEKDFKQTKWWADDKDETITPDHLDYDEHVEARKKTIFAYNRILFFLQGLLDRSKVFSPHPPMNLADHNVVMDRLNLVFDEEMGLPSANPPKWEEYRERLNATIKKGSVVWCGVGQEYREFHNMRTSWKRPKYEVSRPRCCEVASVSVDRKTLKLRWSLGDKIKDEWVIDKSRPVPNKPGYYYQKKLEHNLGERFGYQIVEMRQCFAVEAYQIGDYKKFLCDAYLKGDYLEWAPQLLGAEEFHQKKVNPKWKGY